MIGSYGKMETAQELVPVCSLAHTYSVKEMLHHIKKENSRAIMMAQFRSDSENVVSSNFKALRFSVSSSLRKQCFGSDIGKQPSLNRTSHLFMTAKRILMALSCSPRRALCCEGILVCLESLIYPFSELKPTYQYSSIC